MRALSAADRVALARAKLAREVGVESAARRSGVSPVAIRRALRTAAELSAVRQFLALIDAPST